MKRSKFNLGHYKLLTCKMGQLVPVTWFETLPGDTIEHATSALVRCAPLATPVMHPIQVRFHHFFVPNRIMWQGSSPTGQSGEDSWEAFITGGFDGNCGVTAPHINLGGSVGVGTLGDYLGVNTSNAGGNAPTDVSALPFRAYAMIWNEFFRDQDLQTQIPCLTTAGADFLTNTSLQNVCWEKDYNTSARPWVVKGPSVTIPLGTTAPILGIGIAGTPATFQTPGTVRETSPEPNRGYTHAINTADNATTNGIMIETDTATGSSAKPKIFADLSNASAVTINTLRHALAVQRFEEARARYGSRYTEYLRYLGVRSSDARLQRPELLGSGRATLQISEVLQTSVTTSGGTAGGAGGVGQFGGHGISAMRSNRFRRFFEEHGIVMTLLSVRPRTMYSQGLARGLLRGVTANSAAGQLGTKEDYWQKELQHIGQQGVAPNELDVRNDAGSATTWGYQDRYDEYRRLESTVHAAFKSTLDTWHLSREFTGASSLNSAFVQCVPSTRIYADTSADNLYIMCNHSIQARRLVARSGTSMTF